MDNITITVAMIKEIRERTGISFIECKKALIKSQGNIEIAIDNMRKVGQLKAFQKSKRITAEGIILTKITNDRKYGIIIEINCETDFVAKNSDFKSLCEKIITVAIDERIIDIENLKNKFKNQLNELIFKLGENINIRRIGILEGENLVSYLHHTYIGVIVSAINNVNIVSTDINKNLVMKHIAMHIADRNPEYINVKDIPSDVLSHENKIQLDIVLQSGSKSQEITKKIVEGRMRKFFEEICLNNQIFILDQNKTVGHILCEYGIKINKFIRFELGQCILK